MYLIKCLAVLEVIVGCYMATGESEVAKAFIKNKLTPNIVATAPTELLTVEYDGISINLGTVVTPLVTLTEPSLMTYNARNGTYHTLAFFGPDLPLDIIPPITQFLHGLCVNIPGNNVTASDKIATYFPPIPYPLGLFYIFVLYEQEGYLNTSEIPNMSLLLSRPQFDINSFATKHNLTGPIAGNFMKESYLAVVPETLQTLEELQSEILSAVIP